MKIIFIVLGLLARLLIIAIPLFVLSRYKEILPQPIADWPSEAKIYIAASLALLILADYIKDIAKSYKKNKEFNPLQRAARETGATVTTLLEYGTFDAKCLNLVIESALRQIETIIEVSLGKSRSHGDEFSANCMRYRTQRRIGPSLSLTHWGTRLAGREPITLSMGIDLPGACAALENSQIGYIKDTQSKENTKHFTNKNYRSIVSIPLFSGSKKIGVVNIDSVEPNAFGKIINFEKKVRPLIQPQLDLIKKLLPMTSTEMDEAVQAIAS